MSDTDDKATSDTTNPIAVSETRNGGKDSADAGFAASEASAAGASAGSENPRDSASGRNASSDATGGSKPSELLGGLVPKLAIVVAVLASLIAGFLWWQYRQFYVDLSSADDVLLSSLEETRASLRRLDDDVATQREQIGTGAADLTELRDRVDVLPAEIRAVERRVEALQGGRVDARDTWLREQAEYYLVLANTELAIGRHVETALAALELADGVLREIADPNLGDVRAAIATERQALRAVRQPDLEGMSSELGALIARIPELPMRAGAPENYGASDTAVDEAEPGLGRLWARTKGAVGSIVRVERQDEAPATLLTETERRIAQRQLALELELARVALLERRQEAFRSSLVGADALLENDFDRAATPIVEARRMLGELMRNELAPRLPAIGDSLTLLRAGGGGD